MIDKNVMMEIYKNSTIPSIKTSYLNNINIANEYINNAPTISILEYWHGYLHGLYLTLHMLNLFSDEDLKIIEADSTRLYQIRSAQLH